MGRSHTLITDEHPWSVRAPVLGRWPCAAEELSRGNGLWGANATVRSLACLDLGMGGWVMSGEAGVASHLHALSWRSGYSLDEGSCDEGRGASTSARYMAPVRDYVHP